MQRMRKAMVDEEDCMMKRYCPRVLIPTIDKICADQRTYPPTLGRSESDISSRGMQCIVSEASLTLDGFVEALSKVDMKRELFGGRADADANLWRWEGMSDDD